MIDRFSRLSCFQIIAPRIYARFVDPKCILLLTFACAILKSFSLAAPALTDAEKSIASLSHPHGAQYSFRLSDSAAQTIGEYRHIPVCRSRPIHQCTSHRGQVTVGKNAYTCRVPVDSFALPPPPLELVPIAAKPGPESELKAVLQSLLGRCVRSQLGYWTYEVCIGQSVNQFHVEGSAITLRYSLGNYARLVTKKNGESSSLTAVPLLEIFDGGTNCDETGSGRNSIVGYVCGVGDLALSDVKEHEVCGYKMVVSSREFCPRAREPGSTDAGEAAAGSSSSNSAVTMRSIVSELGSGCFTLADGWWTYKFCPGQSMKQYHATPAGSVDPASEYSLGAFNESASDQEPAAARQRLPVVYREEYSQGTQCDIGSKQHRSTIVSYECDIDSLPMLVQVCEVLIPLQLLLFRRMCCIIA
jgi:hypothetical protein